MDPAPLLLGMLYDAAEAGLSVDQLVNQLSIGPEDLQAALDEIQRRGQGIDRDRQGRVSLVRPVRLDPFLIERGLDTQRIGRSVICFEQVDSTNDTAADAARSGPSDGLVVVAESQRRGRGRLGRTWVSPPRANLLLSIVLDETSRCLAREAVTIAAGLAVAEGVEAVAGVECELKWPNDVLLGGAKLAGVLVERRQVRQGHCYIIGMGLNVLSAPSARQLGREATSLAEHVESPDRIRVLRAILRRMEVWVRRIEAGQTEQLKHCWQQRCDMLHHRARIRWGNDIFEGIVLDVHPIEGVVLAQDQGPRLMIPGSEATLLD